MGLGARGRIRELGAESDMRLGELGAGLWGLGMRLGG